MEDAGVRRVPVTEDGDLVGILTLDDLVWLLVDELDNLTDVIEAESPPY
jgi:CBS domain-containing protein